MKKIINKFLKLDHTKKLMISFVCFSFLMIFTITIFNMINNNQTHTEPKIVIKQKEKSKKQVDKNADESDKNQTAEDSDLNDQDSTSNNSVANQPMTDDVNVSNSTSTTINNTDKGNSQTPEIERVSASIAIVGLNNELIASGNVSVEKGQSVYDGLQKFVDANGIAMTVNTPGKYAYITSIAGLYEKAHGANSGWLYQVNGTTPNLGAGHIKINQNDQIIWYYTYD